ncbi:MAG TPA: PHP domain-containing protein [Anaerolineaceae bacterium]|nr:PHP domain-containing protein [Anaerolineaceae bacterium]
MKTYRAELHIHSVLSPCAAVEMIPPIIVSEALRHGIDLIAITDHNHTANIEAVQKAASGTGLVVLPGMELQTKEEVHSLCLFDTLEQSQAFQKLVDAHLPAIKNNPDFFGEQFVVDASGDYIRSEEQLLIVSCGLSLKEAYQAVADLAGLLIPAHVDRMKFGLLPVLGLVPTDIPLTALEISRHITPSQAVQQYPQLKNFSLLQGGDVHHPDEYLGANLVSIEKPTIRELKLALQGADGRKVAFLA